MPAISPPFSAAVLAGGRSRRYGRDKATAPYHGRPLAWWVLASLADADERFLVANRPYPQFGTTLLRDRVREAGPLGGLHAALLAARCDWIAVAACDLPALTPAYWRLLLTRAWGCEAVAVRHRDGRLEPLAALYHRSLLAEVAARLERGDHAVHGLLRAVDTRLLTADAARTAVSARVLANVNRPGSGAHPHPTRS